MLRTLAVFRLTCAVSTLALAAAFAACGGSSSETPFPLEPDLSRLDAGPNTQSRYVVFTSKGANPEAKDPEEKPEPETEEAPR